MQTEIRQGPGWQRLGLAFNRYFEKHMMIFIPASLLLGFLFYPWLENSASLVPWLFAYITFIMGLDCSLKQIAGTVRQLGPMLLLLLLAHGFAPWIAYHLGGLAFGTDSPYLIGLVLFTVIPLGVSSVIWVGLARGNVPMTLSLIVIDSLLSPLVVPWLIHHYFGETIDFDTWKVMRDLLFIVVIPTIAGVIVNELSKGKAKPWAAPAALPLSKLAFAAVVLINAAVIAPYVRSFKADMLQLVPAALVLILIGYVIGWLGAKPFRDSGIAIAMAYSAGMRNISLGVVLGVAYFEPAASIPVVLTILIQQPTATLVYKIFTRNGKT